jgi:hypothetical protein
MSAAVQECANVGWYLLDALVDCGHRRCGGFVPRIVGLIMKAIIEEGPQEMCEQMQYFSLAEGALPLHLHRALFTQSTDNRMLTHRQPVTA